MYLARDTFLLAAAGSALVSTNSRALCRLLVLLGAAALIPSDFLVHLLVQGSQLSATLPKQPPVFRRWAAIAASTAGTDVHGSKQQQQQQMPTPMRGRTALLVPGG